MFRFALGVLALVCALLAAPPATAQQQAPLVGIDPVRTSLDQIETTARRGADVRALSALADQLNPLRDTLRDKLADLAPRLADIDARLKSLGPAPAAKHGAGPRSARQNPDNGAAAARSVWETRV